VKILVLNAGSSSHKLSLYDIRSNSPTEALWQGKIDWDKEEKKHVEEQVFGLLQTLWQGKQKVIAGPHEIEKIGHRIVHGGAAFQAPIRINALVKEEIRKLIPLAPLHNPANLEGVEIMEKLFPSIPQIAVFDTAFHRLMPEETKTYAIPYFYRKEGVERYGFHGISHHYCAERAQFLFPSCSKIICCHLGNGASLCAILNGKSIDTTMGFTPLEGLMMGTRCGSIDPGLILYLCREKKLSVEELDHTLNFESGLKGISGRSDMRELLAGIQTGDKQARLAFDMYVYRIKSYIGALAAHLEGVDSLIFTGGIGENAPDVRAAVCRGLQFLGIDLDLHKNRNCRPDQDIAADASKVRLLVIHTREEWKIAVECWKLG
jgi:acetate kinase